MVRKEKKRSAGKSVEELRKETNSNENQPQHSLLMSAAEPPSNLEQISGTKEKIRQSKRQSIGGTSSVSDIKFPSRIEEGIAAEKSNSLLDELQRHKEDGRFCFLSLQEMCKRKKDEAANDSDLFSFRCQMTCQLHDAWVMLQELGTLSWGEKVFPGIIPEEERKKNKDGAYEVKVKHLFFHKLGYGRKGTLTEMSNGDKKLNQTHIAESLGITQQAVSSYSGGKSSGVTGSKKVTAIDKEIFKRELKLINRLCIENDVGQNRATCIRILKDLMQKYYPGEERCENWYGALIRECDFVYSVPRLQTLARQNAENDIRNFVSYAMLLEYFKVNGLFVKEKGNKHAEFPARFMSNQDCTTIILSDDARKDKKIAIARDLRNEFSSNGCNVKSLNLIGHLPHYIRLKTLVVTTMEGAVTDIVFIVKCDMKDMESSETNPAPAPQFKKESSFILKPFLDNTSTTEVDSNIVHTEDEGLDVSDEEFNEFLGNIEYDKEAEECTAEVFGSFKINDVVNARDLERHEEAQRRQEAQIIQDKAKMLNQADLYEKVRMLKLNYPNSVSLGSCNFKLLLAPTTIIEQLLMEIIYMSEDGVMQHLLDAANQPQEQLKNTNYQAHSASAKAAGTKYAKGNILADDEEKLFKKVHLIDGDKPQIDMFLRYINHDEFQDKSFVDSSGKEHVKKGKYRDFQFGKLPAKCSGALQPNDLMEGFKIIKKPLQHKGKKVTDAPMYPDLEKLVHEFLQDYCPLSSDKTNLIKTFLQSAGAKCNKAFSAENVQQGYDRALIPTKKYNLESILRKCRNKTLDYEHIIKIVNSNKNRFLKEIDDTGLLSDATMKEVGIPGLNSLAHSKPDLHKLANILDKKVSIMPIEIDESLYLPADLDFIKSFRSVVAYTRNLLAYILKRKHILHKRDNNTGDILDTKVIDLLLFICDSLGLIRQRACRLNNKKLQNHDSTVKEIREKERKEKEKIEATLKQQRTDRDNCKKVLATICKDKWNSIYRCEQCNAIFDIAPEAQHFSEEHQNVITQTSSQNNQPTSLETLLDAQDYKVEELTFKPDHHIFFHVSDTWAIKPLLYCAFCNIGCLTLDHLFKTHAKGCYQCNRIQAYKQCYGYSDFLPIRNKYLLDKQS